MSEIKLNAATFHTRIENIYKQWERTSFKDVDAWALPFGKQKEDANYSKTISLHTYLFDYEFNESILAFTETQIIFFAGLKKLAYFKQLELKPEDRKEGRPELVFIEKQRNGLEGQFQELWTHFRTSKEGKSLGYIKKDTWDGKFYQTWLDFIETKKGKDDDMELVDVSSYIGRVLAVKDGDEQITIKRACAFSATIMDKFFRGKLEDIIENEVKRKHSELSDDIEKAITDPAKVNMKLNADLLEICYFPIVQSGGKYDLKISAASNDDILQPDIVIASLGTRYKSYCSNIARTYMINPTPDQTEAYKLIVKLRGMVIAKFLPGVELSALYTLCTDYLEANKPEWRGYFVKNIGFGIGIEFRDSDTVINAKSHYKALNGMTFNLSIGLQGIPIAGGKGKGKVFAVSVADTVLIQQGEITVLTDRCALKYNDIVYSLEDEEDKESTKKKSSRSHTTSAGDYEAPVGRQTRSNVLNSRTRGEDKKKLSDDAGIRQKQAELLQIINANARRRILEGQDDESEKRLDIRQYTAYNRLSEIPLNKSALSQQRIYVDHKAFTILLPVYGQAVPFHITMVKNIAFTAVTDMANCGSLRINFATPAYVFKKDPMEHFSFAPTEAAWLKELTYRSSDNTNLENIHKQIKEMQKAHRLKLADKKEKENLVEQDALITCKGKPLARLTDLLVRPAFSKKRATGMLEAHENGFRYTVSGGMRLDILYDNIRHAFFQPCKHELIVLLHFHLKNPIMGPYAKKQKDIQLFAEVVDAHIDLGNRASNYGDRDEIEAEHRERQMRKKLDQAFYNFTQKVPEVKFEMPERKLGFNGVPGRSNVFMMPCSSALVSLVEQPPFVFPLEDVELVHLERVAFGNKNFDMVFVFKDYKKLPVRVSTIPSQNLDDIQRWLHETGMKFSEGPRPLNWATLMKLVLTNPRSFFDEEGGWAILEMDADGEDSEEVSDDDGDAAFEPSDNDLDEEESDDYSEDSEGSSEDYSGGEEEDSEEGLDWDELEEQARREDRRKDNPDEDSDNDRKRRRKSGGGGASSKKQRRR